LFETGKLGFVGHTGGEYGLRLFLEALLSDLEGHFPDVDLFEVLDIPFHFLCLVPDVVTDDVVIGDLGDLTITEGVAIGVRLEHARCTLFCRFVGLELG
jgi:hypothetical protein